MASEESELVNLLNAMEDDPAINKHRSPSIAMSTPPITEVIPEDKISLDKDYSIPEDKIPKVIAPTARPSLPVATGKTIPLTRQQELNIAILSYQIYVEGNVVDQASIHKKWPTNKALEYKAGKRPTLTAIQRHLLTDTYREDMLERGVNVDEDLPVGESNGLTAEQVAVISHLSDTTITKGIPSRLKDLGVKPATYRAWLRQKPFNDAIRSLAGHALNDAIPMAETMLSAQAQAGDLRAIKFLFEVTGRHDPARQQQVDTQALIGVMIDCIQEVLGSQPDLLKELIEVISIRSKGVKGVLG